MEDTGHSSLLKFLVKDTMSAKKIESKVPGEHNIREVGDGELNTTEKNTIIGEHKAQISTNVNTDKQNQSLTVGNTSEIASAEDFTLSPVITVTKKEATFTKGDLKLQKVTVTEDISHTSINNEGGEENFNRRLTYEIHTSKTQPKSDANNSETNYIEKETTDSKKLKTKIPISRLRQVVNRVKNELKEKRLERERETPNYSRKSSIPRLRDSKIPPPNDTHLRKKEESLASVKADEEFDRIFKELSPTEDTSLEFINSELENVEQIENSFEEIIHAYEENNVTQSNDNKENVRQSRIPLLKRRSEHEIEIPKSRDKHPLIKSNSADASKIQHSFKHEDITKQRIVSEQTKTYTQSKVSTAEKYKIQKENINDAVTNNEISTDSSSSNITLLLEKNMSVFNKDNIQNQELNLNEVTETIKVAIPVFDIQTSEDKVRENASVYNEAEDLTHEITITKNLNFDKETVSKIYKIDFTENNFDSLDTSLLNENAKRDQVLIVKNENRESNSVRVSTEEVIQTKEFKDNTKQNESSMKSIKTIVRTDNNGSFESDNNRSFVGETETNKTTENNNISTETLIQSVKLSSETSIKSAKVNENIASDNIQTSARQVSRDGSMTTAIKTENEGEERTSEGSENITQGLLDDDKSVEFDTNQGFLKEVSLETNKTAESKVKNVSVDTFIQSIRREESENTKRELLDECENVEFGSDTTSAREVLYNSNKSTSIKADTKRSDTSVQCIETTERNKKETREQVIDERGNLKFNNISSSEKVSSGAETTTDTETNLRIESERERTENQKRNQFLNKTFIRDDSLEANKTAEIKSSSTNEERSMKSIKSKKNKNSKLDQLSRKYENFEYDHIASITQISFEANKAETVDNSPRTNMYTEFNEETITNASNSTNFTDINKHTEIKDEISKTKYQPSNMDNKESMKSISASTNIDIKANGTTTITNNEESSMTELISSKCLNSNLNKQTITSNANTGSDISLDKTDNAFLVTGDATKTDNLQNKSEEAHKIYSEVFTKINVAQNEQTYEIKKETDETVKQINVAFGINKDSILDINTTMEEDIPILRGKVNRVIRRISSIDSTKPIEKNTNDITNKKSILSKIKMFERGEPDEIYPKSRIPKKDVTRIPLRQTSTELRRPKIVKEIFKETKEHGTEVTGNTSRQFENIQQEKASRIKTIRDENYASSGTKLKYEKLEEYFVTNAKYKHVKDGDKEINRRINEGDNIKRKEERTVKTTNQEISNIITDSKAKSLEFITRQNSESTRKSLERLESEYKDEIRKEFDIRRTTSVAELEIGGVVKGKVHEIIMRINSMEMLSQGKKELIHIEQPRKSSVSEKIALFEGKLPPVKTEKKKVATHKMKHEPKVSVDKTEEEYANKIAELKHVKNYYKALSPEYLELRDGSKMPVIALGTALLDKRLIKHVVEAAIDMGYRAIDTAYIYGNEKEIGEAINNKINDGTVKREDLYIISKLWSTYHRRDLVEEACRQSLNNMGLTYFDLYLIHNPMSLLEGDDPLPKIANVLQYSEQTYMDAWCGIEDLIAKGLVRRGGVSNFNSEQVHRVMEKGRIKPVVNQVECHPYLSQERLGGFCDAYGMRLSCYGVLGSKGTPTEHKSDLPPVIDDPLVLVMAAGLGVSPGQMLIAYQLCNSRSVVIKATSADHLYDNLKAQFISLESSHLTALKSLNKNKRTYYLKGLGETHKNYPFNIAF